MEAAAEELGAPAEKAIRSFKSSTI